ncbi:DUF2627 family protein [Oceanobacillus alkalisoli]|uniref:DUF2627 family protein n=1 Tax=Oceanobacillus alkalisoli TaxID=2925113 RepID=UPI001EF1466C|nr:DUF2627 family protein [Oceanobacillus alkalisoli]MCF3941719.1 DUF2627 domain-containing protein [Oceanobacillus alkalisoli]MCG5103000.1 DUF2627 domain-containing protein [Oceanobacillus alkalisoli]
MRNIAIGILLIPGIIAAIGIKLMRDTLFNDFYTIFIYSWIQFVVGLALFLAGIAFLGGFIVFRDRKNKAKEKNSSVKGE